MKRMKMLGLVLVGSFSAMLLAATPRPEATAKIGQAAPGFTLTDYNGNPHSLSDYKGRIVVIEFDATRCPVAQAYDARMNAFYDKYCGKGDSKVIFLAINSNDNPLEDAAEVKKHATDVGAKFTIVKDPGSKVADAYGAAVTPHMYVVDSTGVLRYVGAYDDNQKDDKVTKHYVVDAVEALLAGKDVPVAETKAFGCTIKRAD